jgi:S-adenosylmethionine:tRNA ribosyltransferase-isomerase
VSALTRSDIWYDLPGDLIAQQPLPCRSDSRLLVADRASGTLRHCVFRDLPSLLSRGDLLVFNDTRVIRARLRGTRAGTGGAVEVLLLERLGQGVWKALLKPGRRVRQGILMDFGRGLTGEVREVLPPGRAVIAFHAPDDDPDRFLEAVGEVPLPPYIQRAPEQRDMESYQTVFARHPGAVAAPTAGLHFDPALLEAVAAAGIATASLTLHVGPGTFEPLRHDEIDRNELEPERYVFPQGCSLAVEAAKSAAARVVAVGSTSARVLETAGRGGGAAEGRTSIFIRPPYVFQVVDALVTNLHLPGSSLLCLVASFMGMEFMKQAYDSALGERYRFYSYGDAMLIL